MRIAVCLSGKPRNYKHTFKSFQKHIIEPLSPDIFIFTDVEGDFSMYSPLKIGIDYEDKFQNFDMSGWRVGPGTRPSNLVNQFYKMNACNNLKIKHEQDNSFKYDLVIRCRFDAFFNESFSSEQLELAKNKILVPWGWNWESVSPYAITDIFGMGNSESMNIYSNIYTKLNEYKHECILHPESLVGYNLMKNNIQTETFQITFQFQYPEEFMELIKQNESHFLKDGAGHYYPLKFLHHHTL